jgi:sigma-B regulation protein RsbU (phosphoserine phosphatase)
MRAYAESLLGTDEILARMNEHLHRDLDAGMFVSYLLLRYSETTGQLSFTGAGHEHLVLYRPSTGQLEFVRAGGVVLGLVPDVSSRLSERGMTLQRGDVVCLYTDGATEARAPNSSEEFGLERIGEAVKRGPTDPDAIVQRVMQEVLDFTGSGQELHDDLTVVALRKT